ncbi:hypothetical protein V2594_14655, partial [Tenacibaculum maritimum]|uniref:hypothetical protein n=1 Tax=Tenacibaculum maritimum TaxID=107401 RepID=UPI0038767065
LDLKLIKGGVDGFVSIIRNHIKCNDRLLIKKQIIKSDDIFIKGLENFDVLDLAEVVRYIAYGVLDIDSESDYISENLKGDIFLFGEGETHFDKCKIFIEKSSLEDDEKEMLVNVVEKSEFNFSFLEILKDFFENPYYPEYYKIISYVTNLSIEKEYRLTQLNIVLDELQKAINKNDEILSVKSPNHLKGYARIANNYYQKNLDKINESLSQYVNLLGNRLYGLEVKARSREEIIKELCDLSKVEQFLKYEEKLVYRGYISNDYNKWNKKPVDFISFYKFCEDKLIFHRRHELRSSGVKLLRELYSYEDGNSIDAPNKRNSRITKSDYKAKYFFLNMN